MTEDVTAGHAHAGVCIMCLPLPRPFPGTALVPASSPPPAARPPPARTRRPPRLPASARLPRTLCRDAPLYVRGSGGDSWLSWLTCRVVDWLRLPEGNCSFVSWSDPTGSTTGS